MLKTHPDIAIGNPDSGFCCFPLDRSYSKFVVREVIYTPYGAYENFFYRNFDEFSKEQQKQILENRDFAFKRQFGAKLLGFLRREVPGDAAEEVFNRVTNWMEGDTSLGESVSDAFRGNLEWFDSHGIDMFFDVAERHLVQEKHKKFIRDAREYVKSLKRGTTPVVIPQEPAFEYGPRIRNREEYEIPEKGKSSETDVRIFIGNRKKKFEMKIQEGTSFVQSLLEDLDSMVVEPIPAERNVTERERQESRY